MPNYAVCTPGPYISTVGVSSRFLCFQFNSIPNSQQNKKTHIYIYKKNNSESHVQPRAPISVVLKLLRSTSRVLSGTAGLIHIIHSERARSRADSRRPHRFKWLWPRLAPLLLRRVLAYRGTIKELWRRRRLLGAIIGDGVRVEFVYWVETTVCVQALNGGFVLC